MEAGNIEQAAIPCWILLFPFDLLRLYVKQHRAWTFLVLGQNSTWMDDRLGTYGAAAGIGSDIAAAKRKVVNCGSKTRAISSTVFMSVAGRFYVEFDPSLWEVCYAGVRLNLTQLTLLWNETKLRKI